MPYPENMPKEPPASAQPPPASAAADLCAGYVASEQHYHELLDAKGGVRPHWKRLLQVVSQSSARQMQQRQQLIQRQIRENGVTYNVYADPQGADRLWQLDLMPNLLPAAEWQTLAAGVAQRARLLNAVLADLYGEQTLLQQGLLPTDLVYGHNHYLWPARGIQPAGNIFLHSYAVDMARAPDGRWWVLADRTQAPSGAGYALENRQILARALPDLFRELRVQHLSRYLDTLRDTLTQLSPCAPGETPLAVLLTPGRFNETYFEHLYLAQQLGFPLVEGHDLTVRGGRVYLKTLSGLQRVHAILRRLDADFCDPLELRADSALGVPGLLDAARGGEVVIANALGSGVLESPGLLGFLPKIAEQWLGETLTLPAVATWWCGEQPALQATLAELAQRVIKPAFPSQRFGPTFGAALDEPGLTALAKRLQERPYAYVAQEQLLLSQAPVWCDNAGRAQLLPQSISLRVYAVATADGNYYVMPGGLTRVAGSDSAIVSLQRGGSSKDTWVLADGLPQGEAPRARPLGTRDLLRESTFLPSSIAENLFWFGRYSERCDSGARLLRAAITRYINDDDSLALHAALGGAAAFELLSEQGDIAQRLLTAVHAGETSGSLLANLQRLHSAGSQVRGRLSHENWRALTEIQRDARLLEKPPGAVGEDPEEEDLGDALEQLDHLLLSLAALSGFAHDDMTRDDGWRFLMVGRRIERLQCLCSVFAQCLRQQIVPVSAQRQRAALDWLLEIGNSTITYRSRYLTSAQLIPVLDLLLLDSSNPHALLFQLNTLDYSLTQFAQNFSTQYDASLQKLTQQLAALDLGQLEHSLFGDSNTATFLHGLADLLDNIAEVCGQLSDQLHLRHFAHVDAVSQQTQSS